MEKVNNLFRYGNILIKYKLCPNDTKHAFCIEYNGKYYSFIMKLGNAIDLNEKEITNIKGTSKKGKHFNEWSNSSLNLINQ